MVRPIAVLGLWLLLLGWLHPGLSTDAFGADTATPSKRHLLILNSYNKGYGWTDNIVAAIEDAFAKDRGTILHVEYMDTKVINDERHFSLLRQLLEHKYRNLAFDAIIASDDDALLFLQGYGRDLFPATPVVFCGIANYSPDKTRGIPQVTGVTEAADFRSTLQLIADLHDQAHTLYVISDQLTAGKMILEEFNATAADFTQRWNFVYLTQQTMEEILVTLRGLGPDAVVFYLSFFRDASGRSFDPTEAIPLIAEAAPVPIYGQVDYMVGLGVMGGMVKSAYYQGQVAAVLAKRILAGEAASSIPVVMASPNAFMFDFVELDKAGLSPADLPAGSLILNEPQTFYYQYQKLIWTVLTILIVLLAFIVTLLINIQKRKRAQRGLEDILDAMKTLLEPGSLDRIKEELGRIICRVIFLDRRINVSLAYNYTGQFGAYDGKRLLSLNGDTGKLDGDTRNLIQDAIEKAKCLVNGHECVALFRNPSLPGNVIYLRGDRRFDDMDRNLLEILANNVSMAIDALEKSKLQESLETARAIQQSMLPRDFQIARLQGRVELFARLVAAKEVGGDLYDFFGIDEDHYCFVIGDVSGKGVPASLFMAMAKTLIRSASERDARPQAILAKANHELARDNDHSMFVTLFLAILDRRDGSLSYANAGHNPPYILTRHGGVHQLPLTVNLPLGVWEGAEYACDTVTLDAGDGLFLYTDGVSEAMSPTNEEFGLARLEPVLATHAFNPAEKIIGAVMTAVHDFAAGAPQSDDITVMFLRLLDEA